MSKYLTEFDEIQAAFRKVRLDENCMVYRNGMLLEHQDTYNKIQKLLNTPEMSEAHRYLYDMDVESLSQDEIERVDKLFDLGVKKGFIDNSFEEELEKSENPDAIVADEEPKKADAIKIAAEEKPAEQTHSLPIPCWTILYSATKDGETKCGECYSNAISVSAAKADCLAKLERFGYGNVSVLAIEAGDPDCVEDDSAKCQTCGERRLTEADESDEDNDEGSDDTGDDDGDDTGDDAGDDTGDSEGSDESGDDAGDDSENDEGSDEGGDEGGDAGDDAGDDSENDEGSDEGGDSEGEETKELSDEEKAALKDEYKTTFREVMLACKFDGRSFIDLTIPEKVQFFSTLNVRWKKNDPKDFMSEEEIDQLESIVVSQQ